MTPLTTRRLLHAGHGVATLALLATGFLIQWPDLRAQLVGGYGRQLAEIHLWSGWVFILAPLLALMPGTAGAVFADLRRRLGPPDGITWRKLHIVITLLGSVLLGVSGIVLWGFQDLPQLVQDVSLEVHIWATWVFTATLLLHLAVARRATVERVRLLLGGEPPPLFEFVDDDPDAEDP